VLASVAWIWTELEVVRTKITTTDILQVQGVVADDSSLLSALGIKVKDRALAGADVGPDQPMVVVQSSSLAAQQAGLQPMDVITHVAGVQVSDTQSLIALLGTHDLSQGIELEIQRRIDIRLYVQAAVAVALLLTGGGLLWWILNKPRVADFLIATEAEMRKVNWPTSSEIIGSTWVVICGTIFMAVLLFVVDIGFALLFRSIGVLEGAG